MTIILTVSIIASWLLIVGAIIENRALQNELTETIDELETTTLERDTLARLAASQTVHRLNTELHCRVLASSLAHSIQGNQDDALAILGEFTTTSLEEIA